MHGDQVYVYASDLSIMKKKKPFYYCHMYFTAEFFSYTSFKGWSQKPLKQEVLRALLNNPTVTALGLEP